MPSRDWADEAARNLYDAGYLDNDDLIVDEFMKGEFTLDDVAAAIRAAAPSISQKPCDCLSRADGIGSIHGHHDKSCPRASPSVSSERLQEIRARVEAASEGPWLDKGGDAFGVIVNGKCLLATSYMLSPNSVYFRFKEDRNLTVHAKSDLAYLLGLLSAPSDREAGQSDAENE